ncbi:MAG: hypothetical protein LBV72_10145 [Tannerella sp.]|jgi:hypothetical protein|nr:hypothetical protein [Tannerella sp.]
MQNEKMYVNLGEGVTKAEVIIREGSAMKILDPKPPVKVGIVGVIGAPLEFLSKRLSDPDQIEPKRCHILVDREKLSIELITSEDNEYQKGSVKGILQLHPKFEEFGINSKKTWEPAALGQFFKMNRSFFPNRDENMQLVSDLKNFNATINANMERQSKENGSMKASYGQVVNSNLPEAFTLNIPIFKGVESTTLQVEAYATIDGGDVFLQLFSPAANQMIEEMRDSVINEQITSISELCPGIAIIEQ